MRKGKITAKDSTGTLMGLTTTASSKAMQSLATVPCLTNQSSALNLKGLGKSVSHKASLTLEGPVRAPSSSSERSSLSFKSSSMSFITTNQRTTRATTMKFYMSAGGSSERAIVRQTMKKSIMNFKFTSLPTFKS